MTIINKTKFLEFKSAQSKSGHEWYYVKRTNDSNKHDSAVVITTLVKNKDNYNFLFLKTSRPPITAENKAEFCLESPAGLIGDIDQEESLETCIQKELLEETGLEASKIFIELTNSSTSAGLSSETLSYATAIVENANIIQPPIDDGGVIVERFEIESNLIYQYLKSLNNSNISVASATVCGIYFALERLKN